MPAPFSPSLPPPPPSLSLTHAIPTPQPPNSSSSSHHLKSFPRHTFPLKSPHLLSPPPPQIYPGQNSTPPLPLLSFPPPHLCKPQPAKQTPRCLPVQGLGWTAQGNAILMKPAPELVQSAGARPGPGSPITLSSISPPPPPSYPQSYPVPSVPSPPFSFSATHVEPLLFYFLFQDISIAPTSLIVLEITRKTMGTIFFGGGGGGGGGGGLSYLPIRYKTLSDLLSIFFCFFVVINSAFLIFTPPFPRSHLIIFQL